MNREQLSPVLVPSQVAVAVFGPSGYRAASSHQHDHAHGICQAIVSDSAYNRVVA